MKCPYCQAELQAGDNFCSECGRRVATAAAPPARPAAQAPAAAGEIRRFEGHQAEIAKLAFSADGRHARSIDNDGVICMWDLESGRQLRRLLPIGNVTTAVALSADGRRALAFGDGMHVWDLDGEREIHRFAWTTYVMCAALSRDGRHALFDDRDNAIQYWDLDSGRALHCLVGHSAPVECFAFSPDGRYALSGAMEAYQSDRAVIMWDLQGGRELRHPERQMMLVNGLAFSPDGRHALAATADANIFLWEVESGYELRRYEGHSGNVFAVAFAPDGKRFLSCSGSDGFDEDMLRDLGADYTVRLWDAERQREIHRFDGHTGNVNCVAFSPDGRTALSGSSDKTVRWWRLPA